MHPRAQSLRVVVLGGGPAAAELLLELRASAAERVELEIVAPDTKLTVRAAATGAAFGDAALESYDLADIAADAGAQLRRDRAEAVAPAARRIRLASGASVAYDALAIAVGARARAGITGATVFRDQRDAHHVRALLTAVREGHARRVVFAAPAGIAWTLPLYELALATARKAAGDGVEIELVTAERRPLEVFGEGVSEWVRDLLGERGIRLRLGVPAAEVRRGEVMLLDGRRLAADRVLAVPGLVGRRLGGIPGDWNGFVPTDPDGAVAGLEDVFGVGDATAFPIKQGGIAMQQADAVAAVLAARAGAPAPAAPPPTYTLRTRLLGAGRPVYLRAELDRGGRAIAGESEVCVDEAPWWPGAKVFGRRLTPWMARHGATATAAA